MNKKQTIVLASLLKPVDDPRMFEKFALSMAQTNKYAINIIGFSTKNIPSHPNIRFFPIFRFGRLSLQRVLAPLKYWKVLLEVKPELIIVTTPDLLLVSCAHKIIFGGRIIYDVQENYPQNIIWSSDLPSIIRHPFAWLTRAKEHLTKRMIIHFLVAEKCYLNECSFINESSTVLENKARFPRFSPGKATHQKMNELIHRVYSQCPIRLLYSGTIAESYGIFDCLDLVNSWSDRGFPVHLTIIGYCPRKDTLRELQQKIRGKAYIHLIGGDRLVPHPEILHELQKAHFSLISYRLNPSNQACFPTRVWECLAHQLPMIMKPEHPWLPVLEKCGAGLVLDYQNPPAVLPVPLGGFYKRTPIPPEFYWEHEEKRLLEIVDNLLLDKPKT